MSDNQNRRQFMHSAVIGVAGSVASSTLLTAATAASLALEPLPAMLVAGNRAQESGFTYAWLG
jgi:hypothetical protein